MYHSTCGTCGTKYYHSYKETDVGMDGERARIYEDPNNHSVYFHVTSCTIFEKSLLEDITSNIVFASASFESRAQVYYRNFGEQSSKRMEDAKRFHPARAETMTLPCSKRIEECWFVWAIVNTYNDLGMLDTTNLFVEFTTAGRRRDVESLCRRTWENLSLKRNPWVMHSCSVTGCAEGYVTIDGNEKLRRPMCAVPRERVRYRGDLPTVVECCTNYPLLGGKNQTASRYCEEHQSVGSGVAIESILPTELRAGTLVAGDLPATDDDALLTGCKKPSQRQKFLDTSAGMMAAIRPCGIVVAMTEMYTCESPTQAFIFLLRTFVHDTDTVGRLRYVGYDRSCDLEPFLQGQRKRGSAGAAILLDRVRFLVDIFHCEKHTEPTCMPPTNPLCKYHPHLERFKEIHGANTESCEQGFRRLGSYKHMTKRMTRYARNFFFWYVNNAYNKFTEANHTKKGISTYCSGDTTKA